MSMRKFYLVFLLAISLNACAFLSDQPPNPADNAHTDTGTSTPPLSKELGQECLAQGDVSCAKLNFCGIQGDPKAELRCCLSSLLDAYFSENSQELAKSLGYQPISFTELRQLSREEIVQKKALLFGELLLLSSGEAPNIGDAATAWGTALVSQQASVENLRGRLDQFGSDLASAASCLEDVQAQLSQDEIEKEIFATEAGLSLTRRDLDFAQFVLSTAGYFFQAIAQYDWGFDIFPNLPIEDAFMADINGKAGDEDGRFGDLTQAGADKIQQNFSILSRAFLAFKAFSDSKGSASRVDDYLNWRFSDQQRGQAAQWLQAAQQSLQDQAWVPVEGTDKQVNLSALSSSDLLPNSKKFSTDLDVLVRNDQDEVVKNDLFFEVWLWSVLKPVFQSPSIPIPSINPQKSPKL